MGSLFADLFVDRPDVNIITYVCEEFPPDFVTRALVRSLLRPTSEVRTVDVADYLDFDVDNDWSDDIDGVL